MPIKHAALKQMRKAHKRQSRNQAVRSELKTLTKRLLTVLNEKTSDDAAVLMRALATKLDRAASGGVIHRNTAARHKSRLMRRLNQRTST